MKTSRLVLAVSTCLLTSWIATAPRAAEAETAAPMIYITSASHCYGGPAGSKVRVYVDALTAQYYSSLALYVDGVYQGMHTPWPTNSTQRDFFLTVSLPPGARTLQLRSGSAASWEYLSQGTSCEVRDEHHTE